jgi:hypothetical protein
MAETSANECQGATFEIPVALTGISATSGGGGGGPIDADLDSYWSIASGGNDCNDANPLIHPGASEIPNALDDNCDGTIDEGFQVFAYPDIDADGFGATSGQYFSSLPNGFVTVSGDCNDGDPTVHPGGTEQFNAMDDDCDGLIDEDFNALVAYPDVDDDGYGDFFSTGQTFVGVPAGFVTDHTDCNDADFEINPGQTEVFNGIDDDCDGMIDDNAVGAPV